MAATRRANRENAEDLFVAVEAVKFHLPNVSASSAWTTAARRGVP